MPAVLPSQPIEKTQLDELATLANSKSRLNGKPYAFGATGWLTELNRIRQNLITQSANTVSNYYGELADTDFFKLNTWKTLPDSRRMVLNLTGAPYVSYTGVRSPILGGPVLQNKNLSTDAIFNRRYYRPSSHFASEPDIEYWFPEPAVFVENSVATKIELNNATVWGSFPDQITINRTPTIDLLPEIKWTLKTTLPVDSRCELDTECAKIFGVFADAGTYPLPSITKFGRNAPDIAVTVAFVPEGGAPSGRGFWTVRLAGDFIYNGADFEFGIRLNDYSRNGTPPRYFIQASFLGGTGQAPYLRFSFKTYSETAKGIHATSPVSKVVIPNYRLNFSPQSLAVADGKFKLEGDSDIFEQYAGNLGIITHTPHASIAATGLFTGKTIPIRTLNVNPTLSGARILNPLASNGAPFPSTADIRAVTPAIDYVIPAYPFRHIDEAKPNKGEANIRRGTSIYKVTIWKAPVLTGDIYQYAPAHKETCEIGFMRGTEFVTLEIVEMEELNEKEIHPDWIILSPDVELVYRTKTGNRLNLVTNIIDPTQNSFVIGQFFAANPYAAYPIIKDHYNDTLAMLNQLN